MFYEFICDACGKQDTVQMPMSEIGKKEVICPECGSKMRQLFGTGIHIPPSMRATEEDAFVEHISDTMKHSHPSDSIRRKMGLDPRGKVYY